MFFMFLCVQALHISRSLVYYMTFLRVFDEVRNSQFSYRLQVITILTLQQTV